MTHSLEYLTIGIYLIFLIGLGIYLSRFNKNVSDYVRGGAQGTWWLVGTSAFMSSISAYTFTANNGLAYEGGPTPLFIFLAISSGLLVAAVFTGPWLRQSRALTVYDIIRERFGPEVEQFSAYLWLLTSLIAASIQLWALSVFISSVFGLPLIGTIVTLGFVVLFYSTIGGRWAVMATDFLQSLILVPMTLLIAFLCVHKIGGIGAFLDHFSMPEFAKDFKLINATEDFAGNKFAWKWIIAMFCVSFFNEISITNAYKYLSVKDGREARKSALLSLVLIACGGIIFLLPGMTSRFLYSAEVAAMQMENPTQSAYAVAALNILPNGLAGILVAAMFAATMSSMDTGLNGSTGGVVNNLIPALRRIFKLKPLKEATRVRLCKFVTLSLGLIIITFAVMWEVAEDMDIFEAFMLFTSMIVLPMSFPFTVSLFIKRLPRWSFFFILGCGIAPSVAAEISGRFFDSPWLFQDKLFWILGWSTFATLLCMAFYKYSSAAYKERVEVFFKRLHTPVNFMEEVKVDRDQEQLKLMGTTSIMGGSLLLLLLLVPNSLGGRISVLFLAGFVIVVGIVLRRAAK
ncbi:MAG: sodium:solute symporter [Puniceicoccaceae bacterium]